MLTIQIVIMQPKVDYVFGSIGNIEFDLYRPEHFDGLQHVLWTGFFPGESLACGIGVNLESESEARSEMTTFCRETLREGLAIVARNTVTRQIVGHVINKLQSHSDQPSAFFDNLLNKVCKSATGKAYLQAMIDLDAQADVFRINNTDLVLEIMFLGVLPEYRGQSIGTKLVEYSVQLARELRDGHHGHLLLAGLAGVDVSRLGAATAQFSSNGSKQIGERLGFVTHYEMFYDQVAFGGGTLQDGIADATQRSIRLVSLAI